jgi:predicted RNA binding protein YcfA (HicA-like mRNA interferase family)
LVVVWLLVHPCTHSLDFYGIIVILFLLPRKIRQLVSDLERAGFVNRGGKGRHRNLEHPKGLRVTISGQLGQDALHYQEKQTRKAIEDSRK